ncbi:hypothetical protein DBA29_20315 [Xenophilus aerolatus]|nr:hypothetical protein [Xenophilus aerolatus]
MLYHFYIITNTRTGKVYVGKTLDTYFRFNVHRSELRRNKHSNPTLQADYNEDPTCWEYTVIETVDGGSDDGRAIEKEWVNAFPEVYNILGRAGVKAKRTGANGSPGRKCTIDGVTIYRSQRQMIKELGQGRTGTRHPNFRYI